MMPAKIQIAPSILAADFTKLGDDIRTAQAANAERIHIDVMDGRFVPNITMGPLVVQAARRATFLPLDVHLMIVEPSAHIAAFVQAGADRISVHIEADAHLHRTITHIQELGKQAGVALNPHTPAQALSGILPYVDFITVMTVNPGFGGQKFITGMMDKIREIRQMANTLGQQPDIEVDGGIDVTTAPSTVQAGANILIAGSAVFGHPQGIASGISAIRQALV